LLFGAHQIRGKPHRPGEATNSWNVDHVLHASEIDVDTARFGRNSRMVSHAKSTWRENRSK